MTHKKYFWPFGKNVRTFIFLNGACKVIELRVGVFAIFCRHSSKLKKYIFLYLFRISFWILDTIQGALRPRANFLAFKLATPLQKEQNFFKNLFILSTYDVLLILLLNLTWKIYLMIFLVNLWIICGLILYYFYVNFMDGFLDNVFDDFWGLFRTFLAFLDLAFLEPTLEKNP